MTSSQLYQLMSAGDPRALATVRALTSRVFAGTASPEENATHALLTKMHAEPGSQSARRDLDEASTNRIRSLIAAARSGAVYPSIAGGGGHGGGHHGGGWGRGRSPLGGTWFPWSGNSYAPGYPCYWNLFGWVCPPYHPQPYGYGF